jgi:hypothetical protein
MICTKPVWLRLLWVLGMCTLALALLPALALAETIKVVKEKDNIRASAQFFAKPVAEVKKDDQLQKLTVQGDWYQVEFQGKQGWIHKSAITAPSVKFSTFMGLGRAKEASAQEVALAGKGFTPEVEAGYKQKHPDMNYSAVDMVESFSVPDDKFDAFLKQGGLRL